MKKQHKPLYGLYRGSFAKIHREYHDIDYVDRLSSEEREWMSRFLKETLQTYFPKDGEDHYETTEERRELYNESNARRRCLYGLARTGNRIDSLEEYNEHTGRPAEDRITPRPGVNYIEDAVVDLVDADKEDPN